MRNSFFLQNLKTVDVTRFDSVLAQAPAPTVSSRYTFIPTTRVLDILADYGWTPTKISETKTRKPEMKGFQKHIVRLMNNELNQSIGVQGSIPQIVVTNAHAGTAAFNLSIGLLEKVCLNGLVVERGNHDEANSFSIRHQGFNDAVVEEKIKTLGAEMPSVLAQIDSFRAMLLTRNEQRAFAEAAIELRFDGEKYAVQPDELLMVRHSEQSAPTLWNTFNVVQEAVIQGGVTQRRKNGTRIHSRRITGIDADLRLNRALWRLTERIAQLK